jgi:hypothetical protein
MLAVVLGAVVTFLVSSRQVATRDFETAIVQNEGEVGYAEMLRELRQATCINVTVGSAANCPGALPGATPTNPIACPAGTTASCVSFKMHSVSASDHHRIDVRYDCSASSRCVRTVNDNGVASSAPVIPFRQNGFPVLNTGVRQASCSALSPPAVFTYYVQSTSGWTCSAYAGTFSTLVGRIDVVIQAAGRGERNANTGHRRTLSTTSSVELRNVA